MCGIVGSLSFSSNRIDEHLITKMRDTLIHRGPDGAGTWLNPEKSIGLGHRRLSIIDLSDAASQPMLSHDKRFCLTFNGEIYNHQDIRKELIALGRTEWKTDHSDTEVVLQAFAQWGIDCLEKFRGMFAFAIWDDKEKALWLVRDRVGIKPLYYSINNSKINFASEIKALLQDPQQKRAVNEDAFYHYLTFLTSPPNETLFDGIKKMEAGTWLRINEKGDIKKQRYWDVWDHTKPLIHQSENEIAEQIISELRDTVHLRQVSDVPVGVFLSGGIDSSTNAALFSENYHDPVKTFSIGYQGEYGSYQNELHFAQQMADKVQADHYERLLTVDDLINFLPEMIKLQDEPIADPVCVPVYYVSKLAKDNGVTVCQVGEGADELFCGYPSWRTQLRLQQLGDLPFANVFKKPGLRLIEMLGKQERTEYELLRRSAEGLPVFWGGAMAFTESQKQKLLSPRLQKQFANRSSWEALEPIWQRYQDKCWDKKHMLNWMSYLDLNFRLPELLLMRVDKMSMGVSLEGRVPFLDHKLVELAMSIPASMKTKNNTLKYILKQSVRGVIPDNLIDRKKQGFGVPVYEWFFGKLGDYTRDVLSDFCKQTDFFDPREVQRLMDAGAGPQVWYLLNFALWWRQNIS